MNVIVDGLVTSYQKTGSGRPLVLLHGWGDSSKTFAQLAEELKDDYEIYSLDLPGFGGSQIPPAAWSLDEYAAFVDAWLQKLSIEPYGLIGHSFGGAIAVLKASRGRRPAKLILLASAGIRGKRPVRKKLLAAGAKVGKLPLRTLPQARQKVIRQKLYEKIGSDYLAVPQMAESFKKTVGQDIRAEAHEVNLPTLLIYGSRDDETPLSDGHLLTRAIKNSRLEAVSAGHFLHQEQPKQVAAIIKSFLES